MRYDKNKLFEQAKQAIEEEGLVFIEEIVSFLPCGKTTFYDLFPADSEEMGTLKALIDDNKVNIKVGLRKKWYKSEAPALQMALMKLIASPEEHKRLSMAHIDHTTDGEKINQVTVFELPSNGREQQDSN